MTDTEFVSEVQRHWAHWAQHLGLENWWFSFEARKMKGSLMEWHPHEGGYLRGQVLIDPAGQSKMYCDDLRRNVLHECLHVVFTWQDNYVKDTLGRPAYNNYLSMAEANVDELTSILLRMHDMTKCPLEGD